MAYDGFVLVNSSWLHDDTAIFMEMPAHLVLLRYLNLLTYLTLHFDLITEFPSL
jgi:hypothetical protein